MLHSRLQRTEYILEILNQKKTVNLSELADSLSVSVVTIRKDVAELEEQGLVIRQHGTVSQPNQTLLNYYPMVLRNRLCNEEKKRIAAAAVELLSPKDSLILDAGTTTAMIARQLIDVPPLSIATNSVVAAQLLGESQHSITLAGGQVINQSLCTVGGDAISLFRSIHASKLFLGTTGIQQNLVLTTGLQFEADIKKEMIRAADEVILVVDAQKFSNDSMFPFCTAEEIDCIITSSRPPEAFEEVIARNNIRLIVVE